MEEEDIEDDAALASSLFPGNGRALSVVVPQQLASGYEHHPSPPITSASSGSPDQHSYSPLRDHSDTEEHDEEFNPLEEEGYSGGEEREEWGEEEEGGDDWFTDDEFEGGEDGDALQSSLAEVCPGCRQQISLRANISSTG